MNVRETIARELHAPPRKSFPSRPSTVKGIDDLYQADLVEKVPYSSFNRGLEYLLTVINCFSKVAYALPLKNKSGLEVASVLEPGLSTNPMKRFQTDQGLEFYNSHVGRILNKNGINHYSTYNDKKGTIVRRSLQQITEITYVSRIH